MNEVLLNFRRELTFSKDGSISKGEINIPKIVFIPEKKQWGCYWSISFIKPDSRQCIFGDDPLQALSRTLEIASSLLQDSGIADLKVWWQFEGDNGGLTSIAK